MGKKISHSKYKYMEQNLSHRKQKQFLLLNFQFTGCFKGS